MAGRLEWFPFFAKDFMDGTADMSNAEVGAYVRLLAYSWGNGPLPANDRKLASIAHTGVAGFRKLWETVGEKWKATPDGFVNAKLERVRTKQLEVMTKRSEGGKLGAAHRWRDGSLNGSPNGSPIGSHNGKTMPSENLDLRDLSEDRKISPPTPRKRGAADAPPEFMAFWASYPKRVGKQKALLEWHKLAPSADLCARMQSALDWQRGQPRWLEQGGQFVPDPERWLKYHRWEDEPFHTPTDAPVSVSTLSPKSRQTLEAVQRTREKLAGGQ